MKYDGPTLGEQVVELSAILEQTIAERDTFKEMLSKRDPGSASADQIASLIKQNAALRERVSALMDEKNLAIRAARAKR